MNPRIKLFCLPFAGGSAFFYQKWKALVTADIELVSIELAGRGKRISDPLYADFIDAVNDVFESIRLQIDHRPYFIFGHSMGALLAYDLLHKIQTAGLGQPAHVFFSGSRAPHLQERNKIFHLMSDSEFKREVLSMGGTDPELFNHPELLNLFIPLMRNDFRIVEQRPKSKKIKAFSEPISVFLGKDDDFTAGQCDGWKWHTESLCNIHHFEGGHFFLLEHSRTLVGIINNIALTVR